MLHLTTLRCPMNRPSSVVDLTALNGQSDILFRPRLGRRPRLDQCADLGRYPLVAAGK